MSTKTKPPVEEEVVEERPNDIEEVLQQVLPYWRPIAAAVAVLLGVLVVSSFLSNNRKAANESAWTSYIAASADGDSEMLEEIAKTSSGEVATLAQYTAAQSKLIEGSNKVHTDRDASRVALNSAVDGFTKALELVSGKPMLEQRSMWGLGQAYEGLNDLGKAKTQYQQLIETHPGAPLSELAQKRVESLDSPGTKEFYDWFFTQNPDDKVAASGDVKMPSMSLPGSPDFSVPDPNLLPADDEDASSETEVETEAPTEPVAPPADLPVSDATAEPAASE